MFVMNPPAAGHVVALLGKAVARGSDGKLRMLSVGDRVADDEVILTAQNGFVQLATGPGPSAASTAARVIDVPTPPAGLAEPLAALEPANVALQAALRVEALTEASSAAASASPSAVRGARASPSGASRADADRLAPDAEAVTLHSVAEDQPLALALGGRDAEGGIARVWVVKVPTGGLLYTAAGTPLVDRTALTPQEAQQLSFVPAPNFHGDPGPLQFVVEDRAGRLSEVATVVITVTPVNDAPLPGTVPIGPDLVPYDDPDPRHLPGTADYRFLTEVGTAVSGQVRASDWELDPLRFSAAGEPSHGTVRVETDGRFTYMPEPAYRGGDRFVVAVDDGQGGRALSTVFVEVGRADPLAASEPAPIPVGAATELDASLAPLAGGEVFAWSLAEPGSLPASPAATAWDANEVARDVLELGSLLGGHLPAGHGAGPATDVRLDLALDWGLRINAPELFHDWAPPAH